MASQNTVVRLTRVQAQNLVIVESKRRNEFIIPPLLHLIQDQCSFLLHTGAKLVHVSNGGSKPFMVYGYHYDGGDVVNAVAQIGIAV